MAVKLGDHNTYNRYNGKGQMNVDEVTRHAAKLGTGLGAIEVGANALANVAAEIGDDDLNQIAMDIARLRKQAHAYTRELLDRLLDKSLA